METISYEYEGALYVNLTNRCDCACVFCLRHNGHKGSIYADDLWLDHEPTREEALEDLLNTLLPKKALHEYGMKESELEEFTDSVIANQQRLLNNNFVPLSRQDILDIYTSLY